MRIDEQARLDIATGIVMHRQQLSAAEAIALISAAAGHAGRDLLDVADVLIRTRGKRPDLT